MSNCFEKFLGKNRAFEQKIPSVAFSFRRREAFFFLNCHSRVSDTIEEKYFVIAAEI